MNEALPIPTAGLDHVLAGWNGQGQLIDAVAAVESLDPIERRWNATDVRRRANRTLMAILEPAITRLPSTTRTWRDALPVVSNSTRFVASQPLAGTLWAATRRRGWPPHDFVVRQRSRAAEETIVSSLAWTIDRLGQVAADATRAEPTVTRQVASELSVLAAVRNVEPLAASNGIEPDRGALRALRHEGTPWGAVATIAEHLTTFDHDLHELARRLIEPDATLRWRLFHLGVLGEVLLALQRQGATLRSTRPLSGTSRGPAYQVTFPDRATGDLWFEAAGIWSTPSRPSPYRQAASGVRGAGDRPLGPDILLTIGSAALVIECKYSQHGRYLANGYEQLVTYVTEIATHVSDRVTGLLIAPTGVIDPPGSTTLVSGAVTMTTASHVETEIATFVAKATRTHVIR